MPLCCLSTYIKDVIRYCEKPGNEKLVKTPSLKYMFRILCVVFTVMAPALLAMHNVSSFLTAVCSLRFE